MVPPAPPVRKESPGPWVVLWRKLLHNRVACVGGVILVLLHLAACYAGFLSPYDPTESDKDSSRAPPALFGSFGVETRKVPSKTDPDQTAEIASRRFEWFTGGVHFHDQPVLQATEVICGAALKLEFCVGVCLDGEIAVGRVGDGARVDRSRPT